MSSSFITSVAATLIALSGVTATVGAYAQQQPAAAVQPQSSAAGTTQLAARSNDGGGVRSDVAPKIAVPLRQAPARTPAAPAADCVGPASFCNVYFGS
ncbi:MULTISPECIES: hypothetical protein [Burkholderia]|uniref:hypothetical protein n=1 Tax=Burkholderia TaxID=32008 RepID=UPI00042045D9|nr:MULTISPECIES: hypothetical protein [Burkholderia]